MAVLSESFANLDLNFKIKVISGWWPVLNSAKFPIHGNFGNSTETGKFHGSAQNLQPSENCAAWR